MNVPIEADDGRYADLVAVAERLAGRRRPQEPSPLQSSLSAAVGRIAELEAECLRLTGIADHAKHAYYTSFKALTASQQEADALLVERDRLAMELLARPAMVAPVPVRDPIHAATRPRAAPWRYGLRAPEGM
jgi:hypothetical protein